ncbi:MAG: hypothetical protein ACP5UT_00525 [Bryobacteraceae bacterium]
MSSSTWGAAIAARIPTYAEEGWSASAAHGREEVWQRLADSGLVWRPREYAGLDSDACGPLVLSWPEEWTAEHWRDAARHVLDVEEALRREGWTLRTVQASFVQFRRCRPVWISQTALAPFDGRHWPGLASFVHEVLAGLERAAGAGRTGLLERLEHWRNCRKIAGVVSRRVQAARGEDLRVLRHILERCVPRRRWSPCLMHQAAAEPAGLAGIVANEEARKRRARLIYEWRRPEARASRLSPLPETAWVRFHPTADHAAADYLEERAAHGAALPVVEAASSAAHPRSGLEADLGVAVGRGNVPADQVGLERLAWKLSWTSRVVVVEFIPEKSRPWDGFLAAFSAYFRLCSVVEGGAGRRICVMERIRPAAAC